MGKKQSMMERKQCPRLSGADLYVARLGWCVPAKGGSAECCDALPRAEDVKPERQASGSLHDELLDPNPRHGSTAAAAAQHDEHERWVRESRPCYRCVAYMSSAGIKRVFWTTKAGKWEGAKVRDLVDALDGLGSGDMVDVHATAGEVFVTKHEMLMLRRTTLGGGEDW